MRHLLTKFTLLKTIKRKIFILVFSSLFLSLNAQQYEHLIIYGQSLSTGHQSWPPLSATPVSGNYMIGNQIWTNFGNTVLNKLNPLVASVASSTATLAKNRASMIYAECALVGATNHIQLKTIGQNNYIASACGTGGKTIEELSKEHYNPVCYTNFTNAITYASTITSNLHCPAIVWMQGEYNYTVPTANTGLTSGSRPTADKAIYKSLLLTLKNNMQADIKRKYNQTDSPLFITYQAGTQYTRGNTLEIGMAQLEASNENNDIICAGPVYPMTDRGGHLDSNGYRWYGEILGKVYYKTKVLGEDFSPLQPMEISRTDNLKVLKIKFLVPQLPLVLDELLVSKMTSYGFEVLLNGSKKIISNVSIDGDCVYITCISDLIGDVEVIYAGINNTGHGNLRDSDTYPAFFNYLDLDKKNLNGTYVFERDAAETTLRPAYEPKDTQGVIYDKPYPLYNFSIAFYYKLKAAEQSYLVPNLSPKTAVNEILVNNKVTAVYLDGGLQIYTDVPDISRIDLFDISGKIVSTLPIEKNHIQNRWKFKLPELSKGVYLVKCISPYKNYTSKLFIK